jgi:hypothetical protein
MGASKSRMLRFIAWFLQIVGHGVVLVSELIPVAKLPSCVLTICYCRTIWLITVIKKALPDFILIQFTISQPIHPRFALRHYPHTYA